MLYTKLVRVRDDAEFAAETAAAGGGDLLDGYTVHDSEEERELMSMVVEGAELVTCVTLCSGMCYVKTAAVVRADGELWIASCMVEEVFA
jgi:hypothetical protein